MEKVGSLQLAVGNENLSKFYSQILFAALIFYEVKKRLCALKKKYSYVYHFKIISQALFSIRHKKNLCSLCGKKKA